MSNTSNLPRGFLKGILQRHLYLIFVGVSLLAFMLARQLEGKLEITLLAASLVMLVTIIALERWLPFQATWRNSQGDVSTDASSAIVLIGMIDPALKAILPVCALLLLAALPAFTPSGLKADFALHWEAFGFWSTVLVALLFSEFVKYWAHRLHHQVQGLWWLHAMHHSSRRLYWLNGFRFHPLNYVINTTLSLLPLWLIGIPVEAMLAVQAITQPVILLQHANIDLRSGWLNQVISTNQVHRNHHSKHAHQAISNFGNALLIWDQLFGTYRVETAPNIIVEVGLFESSSTYPATHSYWRQLRSMFTPSCCKESFK